jgi:hypothetical protein
MQQIFIELYNYRASWHALPAGERRRFSDLILADAQGLIEHGCRSDRLGYERPGYRSASPLGLFLCLSGTERRVSTRIRSENQFIEMVRIFEQVNVSGASLSPTALLDANVKLRKPETQKTGS